jgi:hypothetical protein
MCTPLKWAEGSTLIAAKIKNEKSALVFVADQKIDHIDQRQQHQINGTNHVRLEHLTPVQEFCSLCYIPEKNLRYWPI